ncbi:MAG: GNAT family N-acetyltransferase [Acidobacteriota bacterium]|nr:GNAT family N-acetyltransferase [Acidobacteriota bacterium]
MNAKLMLTTADLGVYSLDFLEDECMSEIPELVPVQLRAAALDDAPAMTRLLEGDTALALQTATMPIPYNIEAAHCFLRTADLQSIFSIVVKNELVGMIGIIPSPEPVEIGYWIGRMHWGQGYASEAIGLLLQEARRRGITRLAAEVFPDNLASMRVLQKNGFVNLGKVQRHLPQRGGSRYLIRFQREL